MQPQSLIGKKYRLLELLSIGSMGRVWRARNESVDAEVVLKILSADDVDSNELYRARFRHEAHVGALLQHPGIVRVFDLLEEPSGDLALVMEHVRGDTLRGLLKTRGPLSAAESLAIVRDVGLSLVHAHAKGIVHRDIKPTNILLEADDTGRGRPRLCDFGIARSEAGVRTATGDVVGTPQYMSPEQIVGETVDGRSDLYSLALVAYECMTGQNPFRRDSPESAMAAVLNDEIDHDPKIPIHVWGTLQRALSKRPYERFLSVKEFLADLDEAIARALITLSLPEVSASARSTSVAPEVAAQEDDAVHLHRRSGMRGDRGWLRGKRGVLLASLVGAAVLAAILLLLLRSRPDPLKVSPVGSQATLEPLPVMDPVRTDSASSGSTRAAPLPVAASPGSPVVAAISSQKGKAGSPLKPTSNSPHVAKPKQKKEPGLSDSIGKPDF